MARRITGTELPSGFEFEDIDGTVYTEPFHVKREDVPDELLYCEAIRCWFKAVHFANVGELKKFLEAKHE